MSRKDFYRSEKQEPHFERRKQILQEFPQVKRLFGIDRWLKYKAVFLVLTQLGISAFLLPENGWLFLLVCILVGGTLGNILFLAIHEITHDLAFRKKPLNNLLAIFTNIPLVFPFSMAFKTYHAEHHWHQGKEGIDTDIPGRREALIFQGFLGKLIWLINQILFYALRPILTHPIKIDGWLIGNTLFQLGFMGFYIWLVGWYGLLYLVLSLFFAGGLHPIAGHFIAEHYVFKEGQETYSYYGPLNRITFNVGFHNEHHDFPNIPGSRLPELRTLAAPYYDGLHAYQSWSQVLFRFLTESSVSLFSRVKRK